VGFGSVLRAVGLLGWRSLSLLTVYTVAPLALLATAWFVLESPWRPGRWRAYAWARAVRDSSGELLPFTHVGGLVIGASAAVRQGLAPAWAYATTVVDATTELIAHVGFIGLGLALLAMRLGSGQFRDGLAPVALTGLAFTGLAAVLFVIAQRRGMGLVTGLARRFLPAAESGAAETTAMITALYRRPGRYGLAVLLHLTAWIASALGVWLALRVAGVRVDPQAVIGLEALISAVRSAAIVAPMGVGVQEASYAVLGPLFGLGPEVAVALSLIKRARDLTIGLPVLAIWQSLEGRRLIAARTGG
jgi:putative membrane protein